MKFIPVKIEKIWGIFFKELNLSKEPYPFYYTNNLSKYLLKGYVNKYQFYYYFNVGSPPNVGG